MLIKYKEYIPFLYEVKNIAEQRNAEYNSKHPYGESLSSSNINDFIKQIVGEHDSVSDYLMNANFDTVKIVQTVMYIGRDYQDDTPVCDGDALIDKWMKKEDDWKPKSIEISQIAEKMPLGEYLNRAFTILGI